MKKTGARLAVATALIGVAEVMVVSGESMDSTVSMAVAEINDLK
jgi:hypothetical protein